MDEGADMHSLLMTDNHRLLMGGLQNYVVEFDLNAVQEAQKVREVSLHTFGGQRATREVTPGAHFLRILS